MRIKNYGEMVLTQKKYFQFVIKNYIAIIVMVYLYTNLHRNIFWLKKVFNELLDVKRIMDRYHKNASCYHGAFLFIKKTCTSKGK